MTPPPAPRRLLFLGVALCLPLAACGHSGPGSASTPRVGSATVTASAGTAPAAPASASGTWGLSVTQTGLKGSGTTWLHYGDVIVSGTAPGKGSVDVLRDGSVLGHATADDQGHFSATVPNLTTATTTRYSARSSVASSPELVVTNREPGITVQVAASVDATKPVPVTVAAAPALTTPITLRASGTAAPASATVTPDAEGRASGTLGAASGDLGSLSIAATMTAPDGTVIAAPAASTARVARLDAVIRPTTAADVQYTYRAGCPVGPSQLSTITMNYIGFDHVVHTGGVMIVASDLAETVVAAFGDGLAAGFPIKQMTNPNAWKGNDDAMMAADNTSGFNCRPVAGSRSWSKHALGRAVDVNTWENPYMPSDGSIHGNPAYAHSRPANVEGLLTSDGPLTLAFTRRGATWLQGFDWQHFQW